MALRNIGANWLKQGDEVKSALHVGALVACLGILVHSRVDFNLHIPANALIFFLQAILATSIFSQRDSEGARG